MAETRQKAFSAIPARTWRWLGVNEAMMDADLVDATPTEYRIHVPAGETKTVTLALRDELTTEITADIAEGASLRLVKLQLSPVTMPCADRVIVRCDRDAAFTYTAVEAGGSVSATELAVDLAGNRATADIAALYIGDGARKLDLNYRIIQRGKSTDATMMVEGALTGNSEKTFRGTLDFLAGATGSVGRENEHVILLSPKVRNRSVPLMLSGEADVDGHHAVSIGKLDEEKLFYLQSRGLDEAEAKRLVVDAALAPVLSRIEDTALANETRALIERRLSHG